MTESNLASIEAMDEIRFRKCVVDELSARLAPIAEAMKTNRVRERILQRAHQKVWELYHDEGFTMENIRTEPQTEPERNPELKFEVKAESEKLRAFVIPEIKITPPTEPHRYSDDPDIFGKEEPTSKKDTTMKKKKKAWKRLVGVFRSLVPSKRK